MPRDRLSRFLHEENVFLFLLGYRWLSLIPPPLALILAAPASLIVFFSFAFAVLETIALTAFHTRFNRLVQHYPPLFSIGLVVATGLITLTGGASSPYYLFALSPILAAAFFFQLLGGLIAAGAFSVLYLAAPESPHSRYSFSFSHQRHALALRRSKGKVQLDATGARRWVRAQTPRHA